MRGRILVVEARPAVRGFLVRVLEQQGFSVRVASSAQGARSDLEHQPPEVLLFDVYLGGGHGLEFLLDARRLASSLEAIVLGPGLPSTSVERFMTGGAFAVIDGALQPELLLSYVEGAVEAARRRRRLSRLERLVALTSAEPSGVVADSEREEPWVRLLGQVADSELPLLLVSEAGMEKTAYGALIHALGRRRAGAFAARRCPESFEGLEDAMFGAGGAPGWLELLAGGSLLISGVDRLPTRAWPRLAEQLFSPGGWLDAADGGRLIVSLDMATEEPGAVGAPVGLAAELSEGWSALRLRVPALRQRRDHIAGICRVILEQLGSPVKLSEAVVSLFQQGGWPANLRQLRALLAALPRRGGRAVGVGDVLEELRPSCDDGAHGEARLSLAEVERRHIARVLTAQSGNKLRTARVLDINVKTLYNKVRSYGLDA